MDTAQSPDAILAVASPALIVAAFVTGDYEGVSRMLDAAQQIAEARSDTQALASALDQMGFLQHWKNLESEQERDVDRELRFLEQALNLRQDLGDTLGEAESLFHIALVHQIFKNDWEAAQIYLDQALVLAEGGADDLLLSEIYRHIGAYYWLHRGEFTAALDFLRKSLHLRKGLAFAGWRATGLITLGQCELAAGHQDGLMHLREGVQLADEIGFRERWTRSARAVILSAEQESTVT